MLLYLAVRYRKSCLVGWVPGPNEHSWRLFIDGVNGLRVAICNAGWEVIEVVECLMSIYQRAKLSWLCPFCG